MANKTWTMNDTQKAFIKALENYAEGATLLDLKLEGKDFKTGSINTLVSKGYVEIAGDKEYACEVVFNGNVIGKMTKTLKIYKLVARQ